MALPNHYEPQLFTIKVGCHGLSMVRYLVAVSETSSELQKTFMARLRAQY